MKTQNILFTIILFFLAAFSAIAQQAEATISGEVYEVETRKGKKQIVPVINANIYWAGTTIGTISDVDGKFNLKRLNPNKKELLVVSFIGFENDTMAIAAGQQEIKIIMKGGSNLDEIVISGRFQGAYISKLKPIKTEMITTGELQKMACCNLSESFENSATVDVGYSDAVSGAKQIQMLGLAGVYSQLLVENMPAIRGLGSTFGLSYIPGSWMQSIQVSKGAASVANGYESTTGQINVEFKKPHLSDKLHVNLYGNSEEKMEANLLTAVKLSDTWSTMILAHASRLDNKIDHNKDGFLDMPTGSQINVMNRWNYEVHGKVHAQFGFSFLDEKRDGGQKSYYGNEKENSYGIGIDTRRMQAFTKTGFILNRPLTSVALMASGTIHEQNSFFGNNKYDAKQSNLYANLIYQSYIGNSNHKYSAGLTYMHDEYRETYNETDYDRDEYTPGIFAEYTYAPSDAMSLIVGLRADENSQYGTFITPRMHFKYNFTENLTFRASAGKGYRTANIFAENTGLMASSRTLNINYDDFKAEEAWNYGLNVIQEFPIDSRRKVTLTADFYRTDFVNQIIVDTEKNSKVVDFYNLDGTSYSNSFQVELKVEPIRKFEILTAFRYNDVKATINNDLQDKPMVNKYKGLVNLSYATSYDRWKFSFTTQFNGKVKLPNMSNNPEASQDEFAEAYPIMLAQVTHKFRNFEVYIGGENLTDYTQENPIIDPENPFSDNFDASVVWGPIMGRKIYAGIRYTLK